VAGDDDLIRGYAEALFAVARAEGVLPAVEDELYAFGKALERSTPLREALTDGALPAENKRSVIEDLIGGRANPVTVGLLWFVVNSGHARQLPKIVDGLTAMAASERQHVVGEIRSAVDLTPEQRDGLSGALSRATGKQVDVTGVVDPTVIGGIVARVGDEVFDGSVASRLEGAKRAMGAQERGRGT
jgi:F-type H+-transporting ATPase subunit delta